MKRPQHLCAIPNGVDLARFRPRSGESEDAPPRVLFVGRLIFNKGPQYFLDAVPEVLARFPDTRFQIIGDGPMAPDLQRRVQRLNLQASVEFLGQREDVAELLREASMLVRPSLSEGLPLVALEGMASGLPVIATRVGGTAEVVEDGVTGFVLRPAEVDLVADRINRLLADPALRRQMGASGRAAAEKGYDWSDISERTLQVYREAIGSRGAAIRS
jgi:glycosyltransferase involved in cell wall biosynthesis